MLATKERWLALCQRVKATDNLHEQITVKGVYADIVKVYTARDRHYHDIHHIGEGLAELDHALHLVRHPDAVEMAWWFHDYVYDTSSKINEKESAKKALRVLSRIMNWDIPVCGQFRADVYFHVLLTKHDVLPTRDNIDGRVIVDMDLSPLGAPPEVFDANSEKIRLENGASPGEFKIGRARFFENFLQNRPSIFLTEYFRDKYEKQAQENLRRAMA